MQRKTCLNCEKEIENIGDAFCKTCDDKYFICNNCINIDLIENADKYFICKNCKLKEKE